MQYYNDIQIIQNKTEKEKQRNQKQKGEIKCRPESNGYGLDLKHHPNF